MAHTEQLTMSGSTSGRRNVCVMPGVERSSARIDVLGAVAVSSGGGGTVAGHALGGRRARLALVALALADGPMPAERLAAVIWPDYRPATWSAALRGVIRALRASLAVIGAGGQRVIVTTPSGYGLAPGVDVDIRAAAGLLRSAQSLTEQGRYAAALAAAESVAGQAGEQLLPGEDAEWLYPCRQAVDASALRALELIAGAAGALGDRYRAVEAGKRAVRASPLDERSHRVLIGALHRAGDRAGAVRAYEQCRSLLAEQLGVDPDPETVEAYLAALGDHGGSTTARLPVIVSAFIGRDEEAASLSAAIGRRGLVTVAGKGGVGKSRLVNHVASARGDFAGGKLWVSLASASQDELVAPIVATAIGLPLGADDATSMIASHLAPLGRALLVIDGCEAVIDGVASLVTGLVAFCPMLSVVVTSRVPLSVESERVLVLDPFPDPAEGDRRAFLASSQVRLLADRVRVSGGELDIDEQIAPLIAVLCRRCGGLPLALELVAAQLTAMSVADLLDHLPDLVADGDDRLRAVARSSYALLDHDEATLFRRLGVLDGPVGLPLVREMVADGSIAPVRVVRILRELTARGLLVVDRSAARWRYYQDDDLHGFARELLVEAGEERAALERLADTLSAIIPADPKAAPAPYLEAIGAVLPSLRSMLGAAVGGQLSCGRALELAFRLHRYWAATNLAEGQFWLSRLLADPSRSPWTGYATYALGYLNYWSGDAEAAVRELRAAAQMLSGGQDEYAARALIYLGGLADDLDRGREALGFVRQSIVAAQPFGVDLQVGAAIGMGCVLAERADASAAGFAVEAIELCRRAGSAEQLAATLPTAAMVCWQVGDTETARRYVAEAQPLLAGYRRIARVVLLSTAAALALADLDIDAAIELGEAADRVGSDLGIERELPLIRCLLARALLARGDLPSAAERALSAIESARSLSFSFPLGVCLETAALVCLHGGEADLGATAALLAAAAVIRERGDRPGPPTLRSAVEAARADVAARIAAVRPDSVSALALTAAAGAAPGAAADPAGAIALAIAVLEPMSAVGSGG